MMLLKEFASFFSRKISHLIYFENSIPHHLKKIDIRTMILFMNNSNGYMVGVWIVGVLSFAAIWLYALVSWGFLLGLMFGWIPALIGGTILGFLWPLVVLAVIGLT